MLFKLFSVFFVSLWIALRVSSVQHRLRQTAFYVAVVFSFVGFCIALRISIQIQDFPVYVRVQKKPKSKPSALAAWVSAA